MLRQEERIARSYVVVAVAAGGGESTTLRRCRSNAATTCPLKEPRLLAGRRQQTRARPQAELVETVQRSVGGIRGYRLHRSYAGMPSLNQSIRKRIKSGVWPLVVEPSVSDCHSASAIAILGQILNVILLKPIVQQLFVPAVDIRKCLSGKELQNLPRARLTPKI